MDYNLWQWIINAINIGGAGAYFYIVWKNIQLRKLWRIEIEQTQHERERLNLFLRRFLQYQFEKEKLHDR